MYYIYLFFFFKQKTAYEMRISDWSSDVCSSDLQDHERMHRLAPLPVGHAEDDGLDDIGMVGQMALDFSGIDIFPAAANHILQAIPDIEITLLYPPHVAGAKPATF